MKNTVTIKEALLAWEQYRLPSLKVENHVDVFNLSSLLQGDTKLNSEEIEHLILCSECSSLLNDFQTSTVSKQLWETAWCKAAATSELQYPQKIISKNGTFRIEIRQSEKKINSGLISVSIIEHQKKQLEGKIISVIDGNGRELLKGKVKNGEVFEKVNDLASIDLRLMVRIVKE